MPTRKENLKTRSLLKINPKLAREWHPTKNGDLTPADVFTKTSKKAWWICDKGHEWKTFIYSRHNGDACPYCTNHIICEDNCLATTNPELAKEWHSSKNGRLTPKDVFGGSPMKVWWKCGKGHEWKAYIEGRNRGKGCPYCAGKKASKENCLETNYPEVAKEWHPTKNGRLTPKNVTKGSAKIVWWQCTKGHEWQARIDTRARAGAQCPYCCNRKVSEDNCLATTHRDVAKDWHPTKNGALTPKNVVIGSNKKVWWKCFYCGHEWYTKPVYRSVGKGGCSECYKKLRAMGFYNNSVTRQITIRSL